MTLNKYTIDDILHLINPLGYYQVYTIIQYWLNECYGIMSVGFFAFAGIQPHWKCENDNETEFGQDCQLYKSCQPENLTFYVDFYPITVEFGLICEDAFYARLISTLQMAGVLIGSLSFGTMVDRFGRKWPCIVSVTVQAVLSFGSAFSTTWICLAVLQFFSAIAMGCRNVTHFVLIAETVTNHERYLLRGLAGCLFISFTCQTIVAYVASNWRKYLIYANIVAIPAILSLVLCFESPRWLLQQNRGDEAKIVLKKIAKINKNYKEIPHDFELVTIPNAKHKMNAFDLFRNGALLSAFAIYEIGLNFSSYTTFTGMWLNVGNLNSNNVYIGNFLVAPLSLVSITIALIEFKIPNYVNRRGLLMLALGFSVLFNFATATSCTIEHDLWFSWLQTIFGALGLAVTRLCIDIAMVAFIELFPTLLRANVNAVGQGFGRVGSTLSPQIIGLGIYWKPMPYIVFGAFMLVTLIATYYFLPNTNQMELVEVEKLVATPTLADIAGTQEESFSSQMMVSLPLGARRLSETQFSIMTPANTFERSYTMGKGMNGMGVRKTSEPAIRNKYSIIADEPPVRLSMAELPMATINEHKVLNMKKFRL